MMDVGSLWTHWLAFVSGLFALGLLIMPFTLMVAANLLRQKRAPASSVSWLLAILLVPFVGIPLFWLFGERKLDRLRHRKTPVALSPADHAMHAATVSVPMKEAAAQFGFEGLTTGNAIRFHANGEEAYADLLALIEAAKVSIDIEIFILKADAAGQAIFERLAARAKEGVKVRLLIDGLGAIQTRSSALRALRRAGGSVAIFLPIWRFFRLNRSNLRNHRKIAVFDGERVFAGGRNIADEYMGEKAAADRWADLSFVVEGPAALHYREILGFDWSFASRTKAQPPAGRPETPARQDGAVVQVVPSGPDVAEDGLFEGFLTLIFAARSRLWIVTPYFIPNEMLAQALCIAAERGVDLRIIVPASSDQRLPDLARNQFLRDLQALGAKPLLYGPPMLHGKAVLVDDVVAVVGSANFDSRSMFLNFEVSSVIHSVPEIRAVEKWIEGLMPLTRPFDASAGRHYALTEGIARLIAPLL